jgi:cysteinyl-tRNA synthetase, unknown class
MRPTNRVMATIVASALLGGLFFAAPPACAQTPATVASAPPPPLVSAKSWGYQLQNVDPDVIATAPYDMIVIDYSRDGSNASVLTTEDVAKLKVKPDGSRRIVLSYLSIGEAETYRYYWRWYWGWFFGWLAPSWLDKQNTEWRGNYGVRYWRPEWQKIIFSGENSYLERIIKAGFDGVYLDKVDEFETLAKQNPNARADMVAFVKALAQRARSLKPGFFIVPQNGEGLLTEATYRAVIDGLGKEDLLFGEIKDKQRNSAESIRENVARLKLLTAERKPVFVVEYLDAPQEIERARKQLEGYGFIPYFADRALDQMRIGDLPDPNRKPGEK